MSVSVKALSQIILEAKVIRCQCGNPASHSGAVCPVGLLEDLGEIGYWHRSRFKRISHSLTRMIRKQLSHSLTRKIRKEFNRLTSPLPSKE